MFDQKFYFAVLIFAGPIIVLEYEAVFFDSIYLALLHSTLGIRIVERATKV